MQTASDMVESPSVAWSPWLTVAIVALILALCAGLALGDVFEIHQNGASL